MSTPVSTGWIKDSNGEKFAPKTLTSQVQTSDGVLLEDKIQADLNTVKVEILNNVAPAIQYGTTEVTEGATSPYPEGTLYVVIS